MERNPRTADGRAIEKHGFITLVLKVEDGEAALKFNVDSLKNS